MAVKALSHLLMGALLCFTQVNASEMESEQNCECCSENEMSNKMTKVEDKTPLNKVDVQRISEAFGHLLGKNLNGNPGIKFDLEAIIEGIRSAAAGKEAPMSETEYEEMIALVQENAYQDLSQTNLKEAEDFLSVNQKNEQIFSIEEGKLQYEVIEEGMTDASEVQETDSPLIHYTGKYLDGSIFGSSKDSGNPISLSLQQTIPGFNKGIVGMKKGEKRVLYIHPDLAYGTTGQLPPNSLLIFEVELIETDSSHMQTEENSAELALSELDLDLETAESQVDSSKIN